MTSHLVERQAYPPGYRLDRKVAESAKHEAWVAIGEQTGNRAFVRVLTEPGPERWASATAAIDNAKGLVHKHINLITRYGIAEDLHYLIEPYVAGVQGDPPGDWHSLEQLTAALAYAHGLGIVHGNLHPGDVLVDDKGDIQVTGFGLAADWSSQEQHRQYLSPQVRQGDAPDKTDDIYSLGCFIFRALTNKDYQASVTPDTPIPEHLATLLSRMLSDAPFERAVALADVHDALEAHFNRDKGRIASIPFSRRTTPTARPLTTSSEQAAPALDTRPTRRVSANVVAFGLIGLLIFVLAFYYLLPDPENFPTTTLPGNVIAEAEALAARPSAPAMTPLAAARLAFIQGETARLAQEILRLQIQLEDQGIFLWATKEYAAITAALDDAENDFRNTDYETALGKYETLLAELKSLVGRKPAILQEQVAIGDKALADGNAVTALTAFTIATSISPDDETFQARLTRAENIEEVFSLMKRGEVLERDRQLDNAFDIYRQASQLDGLWQPARSSMARVRSAIRQRDFQQAMSDAFAALSGKDYASAKAAFISAGEILPGSPEPADGLLQVEQAERKNAIEAHRINAERHLEAEEWRAAITEYEAALAITETLEFAHQGLAYVGQRLNLETEFAHYLGDPTLLQDDDELTAAGAIIRAASRLEKTSPALLRQIDTLSSLVSLARREVPVTIRSNGETDITVRKHAALGKVTSQVVYLIPGRWTIVGERAGYRDVRENLVIIAGKPIPDVTIASTEKIL